MEIYENDKIFLSLKIFFKPKSDFFVHPYKQNSASLFWKLNKPSIGILNHQSKFFFCFKYSMENIYLVKFFH